MLNISSLGVIVLNISSLGVIVQCVVVFLCRVVMYEGWIVPKGGCVLGGDGLVGGGGLTSKVAEGVTWWRWLNLEGGDGLFS